MSVDQIIESWQKKQFKPVYWIEGEEDFYIDQIIQYAEKNILTLDEAAFNLTIFYGKDAEISDMINACRRYPMFAEFQVVILKEAQQLRDVEALLAYIEKPLSTTIFIVAHKQKTIDKRKSLYKQINKSAVYFNSQKIPDYKLGAWIKSLLDAKGFTMSAKSVTLIEDHIGNDLNRIVNEIDKIALNLAGRTEITEDDIEEYIGINKEYNIFELYDAIAMKNTEKAFKIIFYYEKNPKAGPMVYLMATLYGQISKVYEIFGQRDTTDAALSKIIYNKSALLQAKSFIKNYGFEGVQRILVILHHYNLKSIGIGANNVSDAALLKEMVIKMMTAA